MLEPARVRAVLLALVAAAAAIAQTAACSRSDSRHLPTEPAGQTQAAPGAAETPVGRMSIARVSRPTVSPRVTATPAPATASPTGTPTATAAPIPSVTADLTPSTPTPTPSATATPFPGTATQTPAVTPTLPPDTATPTPSVTPTFPAGTPTPTSLPAATPTRTATPAATVVIYLRGISWQWDFYGPGVNGGASIDLQVGQPYEIHIYNDAPSDSSSHTFSGNADLGLSGAVLDPGAPAVVQRFTPQAMGLYRFLCTDSSCGTGHSNMIGVIQVVP